MYGYNPIMLLASGETLWEKLTAWYQNSLLCGGYQGSLRHSTRQFKKTKKQSTYALRQLG